MIVLLFEATFGQYCGKLSVASITGARSQSGTANPEMIRHRGKRVVFMQEPDDAETVKGGIVKELTGNDTLPLRDLYMQGHEMRDMKIMFKLILMCNKVPAIPTGGKAMKNRTLLLPFMSTWILNAPKTEAEQFEKRLFKRDPFFNRQIPDLAQAFIWLLVQKFTECVEHGLEVPKIVDKVTEEYWQDTDVYRNFARDCITIARNEEGEVDHKATLSKTKLYPSSRSGMHCIIKGIHSQSRGH